MSQSKILRVLELVGLPTADRAAQDTFVFDGKTVALRRIGAELAYPEELLHESFHWLVATPEERTFPEYGLGPKVSAKFSHPYGTPYGAKPPFVESRLDRLVREYSVLFLHQRVGNIIGLGFKPDFPIDRFIEMVDKGASPGHEKWREHANQWLATRGIDVEATVRRMVEAYRLAS
jgi:hypothetical protein